MTGYCHFMGLNKVNGLGILLVFCLSGFFFGCVFTGLIVGKIYCTIVCKLIALFVIKDWQHVLAQ